MESKENKEESKIKTGELINVVKGAKKKINFKSLSFKNLSKLTKAIFSLVLVAGIAIGAYSTTRPKKIETPKAEETTESLSNLAIANGMKLLEENEFAVMISQEDDKKTQLEKVKIPLSTGQVYETVVDTSGYQISVEEGASGGNTMVKLDSTTSIHTYDELDKIVDKVDSGVMRKLKEVGENGTIPVIIQMDLPFDKYHENNQPKEKINQKKSVFNQTKDKLAKHLNKGKFKIDLEIINGVSADINYEEFNLLKNDSLIKKIELDRQAKVLLDTSVDEIAARQTWGYFDAHGNPLTGNGKVVAVIDTGVNYNHPDFSLPGVGSCIGANCKIIGGYNFVYNRPDPMDDNGHGTHVAATVAGKNYVNGQQLFGVAPDAKILAYKVLDSSGSGSYSNVLAGMNRAIDPNNDGDPADHADVVTMSLGGPGNPDDALSLAADNGATVGVVFTIAAGNSGGISTISSPGTSRSAITVAAACKSSQIGNNSYCSSPIASFSSRGPLIWNGIDIQKPDVAAPGVLICAANSNNAYNNYCFDNLHARISGTSMATPHIAGVVALIRQAYPDYSPFQIKQLLKTTTKNLGGNLTYNDQGAGEADLSRAIAVSPANLTISPSIWEISNDPKVKNNRYQNNFSITAITNDIGSIDLSTDLNQGINLVLSKTSLQVANKGIDTFQLTAAIDNDLAKVGNYFGHVFLKQNNVLIGVIPILFNIQPQFILSSTSVDYGVDDPSLDSWASEVKSITIINKRTDSDIVLSLSASDFIDGINYQFPSSITVPASGTATVDTRFEVNNLVVPNNLYSGSLTVSSPIMTSSLAIQFLKYYKLTITDPDNSLWASYISIYDQKTSKISGFYIERSNTASFFLNEKGVYNVIVIYHPDHIQSIVLTENFQVNTGDNTLVIHKSDAKNPALNMAVDENGEPVPQSLMEDRSDELIYLPSRWGDLGMIWSGYRLLGGHKTNISNFSTNYKYRYSQKYPRIQPAKTIHYLVKETVGLQDSDVSITNNSTDWEKIELQYNTSNQSDIIEPYVTECYKINYPGRFGRCNTNIFGDGDLMQSPATQTLYLLSNSSDYFHSEVISPDKIIYSYFSINNDRLSRWFGFKSNGYEGKFPLPQTEDKKIYVGLGPSFWFARMNNSANKITIYPLSINDYAGEPKTAIVRQDYSWMSYPSIDLNIYQNNNLITSFKMPALEASKENFNLPNMANVTLPTSGLYEMRAEFPYKSKGIEVLGKVNAVFNTSLADPNPPAIKRLYYFSNNVRSEVYDPKVMNRLELELDPVGGNMGTVAVNYSKDGTVFAPVTTTLNNGVYTSDIPSVTGISKITLQLVAQDDSNNSLTYTFELPVADAPTPPSTTPTPIPTITPSPTIVPTPTRTSSPVPTPTRTPTSQPTVVPTPTPTRTPSPTQPPSVKSTLTGSIRNAAMQTIISGAKVDVKSTLGGKATSVYTNSQGIYTIQVNPGSYTVTSNASGYQRLVKTTTLTSGSTTIVNFELAPKKPGAAGAIQTITDFFANLLGI